MKPEELLAFQEITGNIRKIQEISKIREIEAEGAIKKFKRVAGSFEIFKKRWRDFDVSILNGVLRAADLSEEEDITHFYYNLMMQMEDNPREPLVKNFYFTLAEKIMKAIDISNKKYAKLVAKREDVTYDLVQKEVYLKAEHDYKEQHDGV